MTLGDMSKETIGALKSQPLLLVVVVLNVIMLGMIGYTIRTAQQNNHAILMLALEKCGK